MRTSVAILLSMVFSTIIFGQGISDYGLKIGLIASSADLEYRERIVGSNSLLDETRLSPEIAAFVRFLDAKFVDVELQGAYLQKGGEEEFRLATLEEPEGTGDTATIDLHFDVFQLLLAVRPKITTSNMQYYLHAGITLDYVLKARNLPVSSDDLNRVNPGFSLGAGISLKEALNYPLFLEFGYQSDFSEIAESDLVSVNSSLWWFQLGISLRSR